MQALEVRLLGGCVVCCDGVENESLPQRSKKGVALMTYLILHHDRPVPASRLIRELWSGRRNMNPENALKTMVSRLRAMLAEISPVLSACVVSGQGTYCWQNQPGVTVDVIRVLEINDRLRGQLEESERMDCCQEIMDLYGGDLYEPDDMLNAATYINHLHRIFLDAALTLIELKRKREAWNDIIAISEAALRVDEMDEPLQIERMRALVHLNRTDEAVNQYRCVTDRDLRLLDAEPSEELRNFYREISQIGAALRYNLDLLRNRLMDSAKEHQGPLFCDMDTFKEFYRIQMRNLERLGSTMFLGLIMLGDGNAEKVDSVVYKGAMAGLEEILRKNLRRGDIVTRFDDYVLALLLPTVNYQSGAMVMERIEHIFYSAYARDRVPLHTRITPLGGET